MADEVERANVLHTWQCCGRWYAAIGPDGLGLLADGPTGPAAIVALAVKCESLHWPFDPTWKPR